MYYSVPERSPLFKGIPARELREVLEATPHHIQCYDSGETIFHLQDDASRIGIILEGRAQAQKSFPNGSQVNVSVRTPGELIGAAAVFSSNHQYPCDVVALEPVTIMMFRREDILSLMQRDLFSYNGIAQKAAFWLLLRVRQSGKDTVKIPDSISKWAMLMNVSRPSLHRELKRLESEGIIAYVPPVVSILDPEALQDVLSK